MKIKITILAWLLSLTFTQAQHTIKGKLADEAGSAIESVVVSLFTSDKVSFVKATVSLPDGTFVLKNVPSGVFYLEAKSLGLKDVQLTELVVESDLELGELIMASSSEKLGEVTITAEKPMVQVMADKTVFNVQNTINSVGDTGFELLRKAPGILIDNNDNIIVEGKTGVLIYIDDKPSVLRGQDLVNYLKTIQASDIDSIEIITQPSSKYDAEGNAGIVNIKFKRDKSLGTNGNLATGITYGEYARYNTSVSFNNRNKKTSLYGSFSNGLGQSLSFINLFRTQNNTVFDARTETIYDLNTNNVRFGFDYYATEKSTLGVIMTGNFNGTDSESDSRTPIIPFNTSTPDQVLVAGSDTNNKTSNLYFNANYRFEGKDDTDVNVDMDYGRYDRDRENLQPNTYFNSDETQVISETINFMVTPIVIDLFTTKADVETKFLKGKLSLGGKFSKIVTDNQFDFYDRINGQDIINPERTNDFTYDEQINAAYFNFNRKFENLNIQFGLRVENTRSDGELTSLQEEQNDRVIRNYTDWFPSGGITYQVNRKNSLAVTYSKRIQRPNYQSLNPFEYKIDELSFSKGNPFLQPQYTDNIKLSHTYNYTLTTSVSYSFIRDYFARITEAVGNNQNFLTTRNVANQKVYNIGISYPTKFTEWWNIYFSVNAYRSIFEATNPDFIPISQNTLSLYAQNTFKLGKGFRGEVSGWYSSPSIWGGTYRTKSLGSLNIAVQKQFFDDKFTARLAFNDILYTSPWQGDTQYGGLTINGDGGSDSQQVRFNLTYNFGRDEIKKARQRQTGLEDEKGRIEN